MIGEILGTIVFGAVIGLLARFFKPGKQKVGLLVTLVIGIVGALVGYWLSGLMGLDKTNGIDWIRWLISIVVAVIALTIYLAVTNKKSTGPTPIAKNKNV